MMSWLLCISAGVKRPFDKNGAQVCVEIQSFCDRRCDAALSRVQKYHFSGLSCFPTVPTWTNYTHSPSPTLLLFQNTLKIFKAAARRDPGPHRLRGSWHSWMERLRRYSLIQTLENGLFSAPARKK